MTTKQAPRPRKYKMWEVYEAEQVMRNCTGLQFLKATQTDDLERAARKAKWNSPTNKKGK